jgi:transposase
MSAALELRDDFAAGELRRLAQKAVCSRQARRLLAIAAIHDGMSRADAARVGGMDRQTLRDWVIRFNESGPDGLVDRRNNGSVCRLSAAQLEELARIVETGPDPATDSVVRWRRIDLVKVIEERFGVTYTQRHISDLLCKLAFSHISARPQHPEQDERVIEAFKKTGPPRSQPM